jgi:hypothetical protein
MPVLAWANHHRLLALGAGFTVVIVALAAGVWFFLLRNTATPIDLSQALRLYRQGQASGSVSDDSQLPPPGVYRYRTAGGERLNIGGISRTFPSTTDLIVTDATCSTLTWEPFVQHVEGLVECHQPNSALSISSIPSSEEIAGIQASSDIRCPSGSYFVPPDPRPGEKWSATCHAQNLSVALSGQIIGMSAVVVGGHRVPALRTRLNFTYSGAESGVNPNEYWVLMPEGMILRQSETVAMRQQTGPLGSVRYSENLGISLESLTPVR